MKYVIPFLLISLYCNAQSYGNYIKITAFRMVNPDRKGHTLITGFIKEDPYLGYRLQATQDDDEELAFALLNLKKQAKQWEKKSLPLEKEYSGAALKVPNMYVIQVNRYRDTIFTTPDNASIYFPDEEMEYTDPGNCLNGLLNENLCSFAERNFKQEFLVHRNDSVQPDAVRLNKRPVYGHTRKSFTGTIEKFQRVTTDSIFQGVELIIAKEFWINNYKIKFDGKLKTMEAFFIPAAQYSKDVPFSVGGIQLGDSEEKLAERFPCSLAYPRMNATVYDLNNNYYYIVHMSGNKGFAIFYIRDRLVNRIEVEFLYNN